VGRLSAPLRAGLVYGAALFACGFLLAPLRILVLEPRIGALAAVLVEAVPLLLAMALLAPWAARRQRVAPGRRARAAMGAVGVAVLLACESALALARGGLAAWIAGFATPAGLAGLALLAAVAVMPLRR
jgi:hypothetical protein